MFQLGRKTTEQVEITVSSRTVLRVVIVVILAFIFLAAVKRSAHSLTLIGIAIFLSLALNAPVHWLANRLPGRRRGNRSLATAISILVVVLALVGFLAAVVPPLVKQTSTFIKDAPHLVEDVHNQDSGVGNFVRKYKLQNEVDKLSKQLSSRLGNISSSAVSTLGRIGSSIFSTLTVLVLTVMMLVEGPRWLLILKAILPDRHQPRAQRLANDMYKVIKGYVNGQVILAAIASLLIVPMLFILGISNPLALMVVVFVCGLIPMVGHSIGAIIVTIVALFHSVPTALIILAYYILYQQIENYVIQPKIQASSTNMSPLLVFLAVVVGVNFGGLLGGLVAIPVMGCIRIGLIDYLEMRNILTKAERTAATAGTK